MAAFYLGMCRYGGYSDGSYSGNYYEGNSDSRGSYGGDEDNLVAWLEMDDMLCV